ncbi:MAG: hypothetical protein HS126_08460 [Anaerolineales bacterium]|nr:hypothetical protein [Anaerolineales bacterium]
MDALKKFAGDHPQITSWIVLAIGMVIILVWSAREVGFTPGQWTALVITTILLAGACVWIIGWEDEEDDAQALAEQAQAEVEAKESQS